MTSTALAYVSFLALIGPLVDDFRKGVLINAYVFFDDGKWKDRISWLLKSINDLLDNVFGRVLLSKRSILITVAISVSVNFLIWLLVSDKFGEYSEVNDIINRGESASEYTSWLRGSGVFLFSAIHDLISITITRYLIRRMSDRKQIWHVAVDAAFAIILFYSSVFFLTEAPWIVVGIVNGFESGLYFRSLLFSFELAFDMWVHDMWRFFSEPGYGLGLLTRKEMSGYFLASITILLPTWLYISGVGVFGLFNLIYRLNANALLQLSKGPEKLYTYIFSGAAIAFVVFAIMIDTSEREASNQHLGYSNSVHISTVSPNNSIHADPSFASRAQGR